MRIRMIAPLLMGLALAGPGSLAPAQEVPESIAVDGVPEIPRQLWRQLERYQHTRTASFEGWLGDRREALIVTRFASTPQVHRVAFPAAARFQLTFLRERVLGALARPGRDQFVYSTDEGGAENYQLVLLDVPGGETTQLSDGKSRHVGPAWSQSGRLLAYSSNARNGKDMDLYVVDPADPGSARRIKEVSGSWTVADWSPDEKRVAALESISINEAYLHLVDVATGEAETITPKPKEGEPTVAVSNVRWSRDGDALYFTTDDESEFLRLVRYDLAAKRTKVLTAAIPWDITDFDLADDGRTIVATANEDGISRLHVLDAGSGDEREGAAPKLPAGTISGLRFRRGSQEFGFGLSSAQSPTDVYSLDLATGKLDRWTESETGGLDPKSFVEPELVHFSSFDGREIPAFVYKPKGKGPHPVLMSIHGGPEGQSRPGFLGSMNHLINELGIAVIFPNVRGSSGYGKSYLKLDNGLRREDAVKDIGALLDWIGKQPDLDASRVAVYGGSYGGYMCLATMTHYSGRLRAGIDVVGISSFLTFLKNTQSYRRDLRRAEYGDERDPEMREHLEAISPLTSARKITRPLLVVAGQNDPRVPASESAQVVAEVRKNRIPVWSVVGKNEGHGFAKKPNQDYLQAAQVLFLKRHLLDQAEDDGNGKPKD